MSILIKGMEMPKMPESLEHGEAVPFIEVRIFADGTAVTPKAKSPYFTEHEVVEVPPHGRLIDADDFVKRMKEFVRMAESDGFDLGAAWYSAFIRHIELAPTVIEAEEGE